MNIKTAIAAASIGAITVSSAHAYCTGDDISDFQIEAEFFKFVCRNGLPGVETETLCADTDKAQDFKLICQAGIKQEIAIACARHDLIYDKLHACGWCYGKKGQAEDDMYWHMCMEDFPPPLKD